MNIILHNQNFRADQKLKNHIEDQMVGLEKYFDRVTSADVFLKLENRSASVQEKVVEIKLSLPGQNVFVSERAKTFEKSFKIALRKTQRQLNQYKRKLRGL